MAWIDRREGPRGRRYVVGWREPAGKKLYKTFVRKEDALDFKVEIERSLRRDEYVPIALRRQPLNEYLEKLLNGSWNLRESTLYTYRKCIGKYIESDLGQKGIGTITADDVRVFLGRLRSEGVNLPTIALVRRILSKAFRQALKDGVLTKNPLASIPPPRLVGREIRFLTPSQVQALADAVSARYRPMVLLAAYGGLRFGEIAGLKTERVDLLRRRVEVVEAVYSDGGRPKLGIPKTAASRRVVMIPGFVAEALAEHMAQYPPTEDGRIFSTRQGRIITAPSFRKGTWLSACKKVGLQPPPRFHDLRHTSVALAIKEGAHPKQIQSRLGHASIQMTLDVYGHLFPGLDEELAERLDAVGRKATTHGTVIPLPSEVASS